MRARASVVCEKLMSELIESIEYKPHLPLDSDANCVKIVCDGVQAVGPRDTPSYSTPCVYVYWGQVAELAVTAPGSNNVKYMTIATTDSMSSFLQVESVAPIKVIITVIESIYSHNDAPVDVSQNESGLLIDRLLSSFSYYNDCFNVFQCI
jgi:hypothetical protein